MIGIKTINAKVARWWTRRQLERTLPVRARAGLRRVRAQRLTYLSDQRMAILTGQLRRVMSDRIDGAILEAGCALGGSSLVMCALKEKDRPMRVYDVFDTIPEPTEEDGQDVWQRYQEIAAGEAVGLGGTEYYGYMDDLYERVVKSFEDFDLSPEDHSVELIKGDVDETLHPTGAVALAHVDVDWYRPVKTCLERIAPNLSVGGVIVLDDYDAYSGCRKATDEFLDESPVGLYHTDSSLGPMVLTRQK